MGEQGTSGSEGGGSMVEAQAPAKKGDGRAADPRLQGISDAIRVVPHFPKPGPSIPRAKPFLATHAGEYY